MQTIILESEPGVQPAGSSAKNGTVRLVDSDSDTLIIEAELSSPQILLITDSYSKGWRAEALSGSSQNKYELLPANWTLRAVPLQAGKHRLRVVYDPPAWRIGKWISALSLLLYGVLWLSLLRRKRKESTVEFDRTPSEKTAHETAG